jgi:hypothetical protein
MQKRFFFFIPWTKGVSGLVVVVRPLLFFVYTRRAKYLGLLLLLTTTDDENNDGRLLAFMSFKVYGYFDWMKIKRLLAHSKRKEKNRLGCSFLSAK